MKFAKLHHIFSPLIPLYLAAFSIVFSCFWLKIAWIYTLLALFVSLLSNFLYQNFQYWITSCPLLGKVSLKDHFSSTKLCHASFFPNSSENFWKSHLHVLNRPPLDTWPAKNCLAVFCCFTFLQQAAANLHRYTELCLDRGLQQQKRQLSTPDNQTITDSPTRGPLVWDKNKKKTKVDNSNGILKWTAQENRKFSPSISGLFIHKWLKMVKETKSKTGTKIHMNSRHTNTHFVVTCNLWLAPGQKREDNDKEQIENTLNKWPSGYQWPLRLLVRHDLTNQKIMANTKTVTNTRTRPFRKI